MRLLLRSLWQDHAGAAVIETALVAPLLVIMALGVFDVSGLVARQTEIQDVAAEISQISMARPPETGDDIAQLEEIAVAAAKVDDDDVDITLLYRCDNSDTLVDDDELCTGDETSTMIQIEIEAVYTPQWVEFGVAEPVTLSVVRTSQIG